MILVNISLQLHVMLRRLNKSQFICTLLFGVAIVTLTLSKTVFAACNLTVTNPNDSGVGSLRTAISSASNGNTICFSIGSGYQTINAASGYTITHSITIDGTTQPGFTGAPLIEINGASAGASTSGLNVTAGNTTIKSLVVNRFAGDGIIFNNNGGNTAQNNYVGTNSSGTGALGNGASGIGMQTPNNTIRGNLVSGNHGTGIAVTGASASGNIIAGNHVGTDASGSYSVGNWADGILITNAPNNTVGGTSGVTPGGACTGDCNLSSGNGANGIGIWQSAASGNVVKGNYAGVDNSGRSALPNGDIGFEAQDAPNNTIGGTTPAERNVFSGNVGAGVSLTGSSATGNVVEGNYIGPDVTGSVGIGNHKMGVNIGSPSGGSNNAHGNTIGGTSGTNPSGSCTGTCNVISSNAWNGVYISGSTGGGNSIIGNHIGVSVSGGISMGNVLDGIGIIDSPANGIGGPVTSARNIISANGANGVVVIGNSSGSNRVEGNYIGEAVNQGSQPNGGNGVSIAGGIMTAVISNDIDTNGRMGIDLGNNNFVTPNDGGDPDGGANGTQNFPTLAFAIPYGGGENIVGNLNSLGNTAFRIEFFQSGSAGCDPSGYGEGHDYIGSTNITTNPSGNSSFNVLMPQVLPGFAVTATAIRMVGQSAVETSEFSPCAFTPRRHADGALIRPVGSNSIFRVENDGQNSRIGSSGVLASWNIGAGEFKTATTADTNQPGGPGVYFREGTVLKGSGPDIYIIDQTSTSSYDKRKVTNANSFNSLGYTQADVIQVPDSDISVVPSGPDVFDASQHPDGTLVKSGGGTLYWLESGQKRLVGTPEVFVSQRFKASQIKNATSADMALADGPNMYYREGTLVKGSGPTIYMIDDVGGGNYQRRAIASPAAFSELGYSLADVLTVQDYILNIPDGTGV
jgi:parallel beta-helix repeat protein